MIEALAANGTNHPLHIGSLPRRAWCREHFLDSHVAHLFLEVMAEDGIAVPQQVMRELVKGKGLPQLLPRPFGGRVGGHIAMKNATTIMGQHQKHVKHVEPDSGEGEEVDGNQLREVVVQERAPGLRRRLAAPHQVFAHAALADVDLFRGSLGSRLSRHSCVLAEAPSLLNFRVQFYWGALHDDF
jgi:hypothetical protein